MKHVANRPVAMKAHDALPAFGTRVRALAVFVTLTSMVLGCGRGSSERPQNASANDARGARVSAPDPVLTSLRDLTRRHPHDTIWGVVRRGARIHIEAAPEGMRELVVTQPFEVKIEVKEGSSKVHLHLGEGFVFGVPLNCVERAPLTGSDLHGISLDASIEPSGLAELVATELTVGRPDGEPLRLRPGTPVQRGTSGVVVEAPGRPVQVGADEAALMPTGFGFVCSVPDCQALDSESCGAITAGEAVGTMAAMFSESDPVALAGADEPRAVIPSGTVLLDTGGSPIGRTTDQLFASSSVGGRSCVDYRLAASFLAESLRGRACTNVATGEATLGGGGPRVRPSGAASVRGGLTSEVVLRGVRRHLLEVRTCYTQALERQPGLSLTVTLGLDIDARGSVSNATVRSDDARDPSLFDCVSTAARDWHFPTPDPPGPVTTQVSLELSPTTP